MIRYPKHYKIKPRWGDEGWVVEKAENALMEPIPHITDISSGKCGGDSHDYYSNGDYWWPNPQTADGLPYIRRDGQTNPDNFNGHRMMLRHMRTNTVFLTAAYELTGEERFARQAVVILREFFLEEETKMNPHLNYAQAIPGVCSGRGIGIIDTLHLVDVVFAADKLHVAGMMPDSVDRGLRQWFAGYLGWMLTSVNGVEEMNAANNHSVCFFVQAAAFALFTNNELIAGFCRNQYKGRLLKQMEKDGSFPEELGRTKPYSYSIFIIDNLVSICQLLSKPGDNLWEYQRPEGQGILKGLEYIKPYVLDKDSWPYEPDVMHFEAFPARTSFMAFAGWTLGDEDLLNLYESLPVEAVDEEARRNIAVRLPQMWA